MQCLANSWLISRCSHGRDDYIRGVRLAKLNVVVGVEKVGMVDRDSLQDGLQLVQCRILSAEDQIVDQPSTKPNPWRMMDDLMLPDAVCCCGPAYLKLFFHVVPTDPPGLPPPTGLLWLWCFFPSTIMIAQLKSRVYRFMEKVNLH